MPSTEAHCCRAAFLLSVCCWFVGVILQTTVASADGNLPEVRVAEARKNGNDTALVLALADCAYSRYLSSPQQGIEEATEALGIAERGGFHRGAARALISMGWCQYVLAQYAEAMKAYLKAEKYAEQISDDYLLGMVYQHRGNLFRRVYKDPERSYKDHIRAYKLLNGRADSSALMLLWQDLGIDETALQHTNKAIEYLAATEAYFAAKHDTVNLTVTFGYMGEAFLLAGEYGKAETYLRKGRDMAILFGLQRAITFNCSRIAKILNYRKNYEEAITEAKIAAEAALGVGSNDFLLDCYGALVVSYRALQRYQEASDYQVLLTRMQDSLFADKIRNSLVVQQADFEAEKAEGKILLLKQQQQEQVRIGYGLMFVVIILAVAGLWIWRFAHGEHKALLIVEEKNRNISYQRTELEQLNERLLTANEEIHRQLSIQAEQSQQLEISQTEIQQVSEELGELNGQLRSSNLLLAQEREALERVNNELGLKNQALSEAEQFRLDMLSTVSHDLKNPINSITGLASVLLDNPGASDRDKEMFRYIHEAGERMSALVRDLLDTAARNTGKITLHRSPTELKDITASVLAHHIHSAERKRQRFIFHPHEEVWIMGDVQRLFQVLDNLTSNAVKYSPLGSSIWISIEKRGAKAVWSVRDEGVGFNEEDKARAFGFFQKLSAQPTGGESSSGVGLAIARQIVELHGGAIRIESEAGKGTTMIVELPLLQDS